MFVRHKDKTASVGDALFLQSRLSEREANLVVGLGLQLDGGLDDVHRGGGTVGDGATGGTSEGEAARKGRSVKTR
jgi:hypothetical protein